VEEDATVQIMNGEIGVRAFVSLLPRVERFLKSSNAFSGTLHTDRLLLDQQQMMLERKFFSSTLAVFLLLMVSL